LGNFIPITAEDTVAVGGFIFLAFINVTWDACVGNEFKCVCTHCTGGWGLASKAI